MGLVLVDSSAPRGVTRGWLSYSPKIATQKIKMKAFPDSPAGFCQKADFSAQVTP